MRSWKFDRGVNKYAFKGLFSGLFRMKSNPVSQNRRLDLSEPCVSQVAFAVGRGAMQSKNICAVRSLTQCSRK
jgi:hypothetical protein